MTKKIAILVVVVLFCLSGAESLFVASASSKSTPKSAAPSKPARSSPKGKSSASSATSKKKTRSTRRRRRRYNPWRVSSYGNPTEGDNPAGEDPNVRTAAVKALGDWNGSAVIVDPNTGRIISIVNQQLALTGAFTPCSTFKPIVGLTGLKAGIITSKTRVRVRRRTRMDLTEALARSNNGFFYWLGTRLGFKRLHEIAVRFGLGDKVGLDIPGEAAGSFPDAAPKDGGVGLLSSHGKAIAVTPLQMAAAMSAIANGGTVYQLQYPRTREELMEFQPQLRDRLDDLAEYIPQVKEGLAAAVLYGTGKEAFDPKVEILGKTGTCSEDGARLGWFVSYSSQLDPPYVVVVLLRGGWEVRGRQAAEIAGRIYRGLRQQEQAAAQAAAPSPDFATILKGSF